MSNDDWYDRPKEVRDKIRTAQMGNKNAWKEWLDAKYAEVKHLVEKGVAVTCACEAVGITRDQYYRRKRIEQTGRDRK
jgi:hypothetical protein